MTIIGNNPDVTILQKGLATIEYRGTSSYEIGQYDGCIMGTNRLPIVGAVTGQQPIASSHGKIYAIQNGEIFNWKELRSELEQAGARFQTDSDTEVWANGFEQWGVDIVNRVDTEMFAVVIWDDEHKTIFVARDPIGLKPLYYAYDDAGSMYFASELKQLVWIENIETVHEFPPGNYYYQGTFYQYNDTIYHEQQETDQPETEIIAELAVAIENAVKKRVDTPLPIAVLLSGGVDSSLVMELAHRYHPDVTAVILGKPGGSDYDFAKRLCDERGYKYVTYFPEEFDYAAAIKDHIYLMETYEPLVLYGGFANIFCTQVVASLGVRILLSGEGADEVFAGYNEFEKIPSKDISSSCHVLVKSLHNGHSQRIDRGVMAFAVEPRTPYLDDAIVSLGLSIPAKYKMQEHNNVLTKYILRKVAELYIPDYVAWRYKVPFHNGAGIDESNALANSRGRIEDCIIQNYQTTAPGLCTETNSVSNGKNLYYHMYCEFGYNKLQNHKNQIITKDNMYIFQK